MARQWSARCYGVARQREGSRQNSIGGSGVLSLRHFGLVLFIPWRVGAEESGAAKDGFGRVRQTDKVNAGNSLLLLPPFPPDAERCALTCVESIICVSVDRPFPASSRNRFSQMPRRAQRTKRL